MIEPLTHTAAFEHTGSPAVRQNRRLLCHAMHQAGFENLPSEWWHFDYGDRFWAYYRNCPAMYAGVFEVGEQAFTFEKM